MPVNPLREAYEATSTKALLRQAYEALAETRKIFVDVWATCPRCHARHVTDQVFVHRPNCIVLAAEKWLVENPDRILDKMLADIKSLNLGDKLGYFVFLNPVEGGYLFYEVCGLAYVTLHWQTVNNLIETYGIERAKEEQNAK